MQCRSSTEDPDVDKGGAGLNIKRRVIQMGLCAIGGGVECGEGFCGNGQIGCRPV